MPVSRTNAIFNDLASTPTFFKLKQTDFTRNFKSRKSKYKCSIKRLLTMFEFMKARRKWKLNLIFGGMALNRSLNEDRNRTQKRKMQKKINNSD